MPEKQTSEEETMKGRKIVCSDSSCVLCSVHIKLQATTTAYAIEMSTLCACFLQLENTKIFFLYFFGIFAYGNKKKNGQSIPLQRPWE